MDYISKKGSIELLAAKQPPTGNEQETKLRISGPSYFGMPLTAPVSSSENLKHTANQTPITDKNKLNQLSLPKINPAPIESGAPTQTTISDKPENQIKRYTTSIESKLALASNAYDLIATGQFSELPKMLKNPTGYQMQEKPATQTVSASSITTAMMAADATLIRYAPEIAKGISNSLSTLGVNPYDIKRNEFMAIASKLQPEHNGQITLGTITALQKNLASTSQADFKNEVSTIDALQNGKSPSLSSIGQLTHHQKAANPAAYQQDMLSAADKVLGLYAADGEHLRQKDLNKIAKSFLSEAMGKEMNSNFLADRISAPLMKNFAVRHEIEGDQRLALGREEVAKALDYLSDGTGQITSAGLKQMLAKL